MICKLRSLGVSLSVIFFVSVCGPTMKFPLVLSVTLPSPLETTEMLQQTPEA